MQVRPAVPEDAEAIRAIYNREVTDSTVTFDLVPRSASEQLEWLTARSGAHAVLVASADDAIVGFASLSPYRERPAYATTVEDSVYVARGNQGAGIGSALLTELVATARRHGFHTVIGRVVGGHEASIALHRSVGFELVGVEREVGRKKGRWLDVVTLQLLLTSP